MGLKQYRLRKELKVDNPGELCLLPGQRLRNKLEVNQVWIKLSANSDSFRMAQVA